MTQASLTSSIRAGMDLIVPSVTSPQSAAPMHSDEGILAQSNFASLRLLPGEVGRRACDRVRQSPSHLLELVAEAHGHTALLVHANVAPQ